MSFIQVEALLRKYKCLLTSPNLAHFAPSREYNPVQTQIYFRSQTVPPLYPRASVHASCREFGVAVTLGSRTSDEVGFTQLMGNNKPRAIFNPSERVQKHMLFSEQFLELCF
jgi:hypothetical protein